MSKSLRDWLAEGEQLYNAAMAEYQSIEAHEPSDGQPGPLRFPGAHDLCDGGRETVPVRRLLSIR